MYRWKATSNVDSEVCAMTSFTSFAYPCFIIRFLDGFVSFLLSLAQIFKIFVAYVIVLDSL